MPHRSEPTCVFGHGVQLMWLILLIGQQSGTRWGFEKTGHWSVDII